MKKDIHVYCTNCKFGESLINTIINSKKNPTQCNGCNPYNPEDSTPFNERPNYIEK